MIADSITKIVSILVSIMLGIVPAYVAWQTYSRGSSPIKHLIQERAFGINPLDALEDSGQSISASVTANGSKIDNIYVVSPTLKNNGTAYIKPTDFIGKLSIRVANPWKILTVTGDKASPTELKWTKISDQEAVTDPPLFNPGDTYTAHVYMTLPRGSNADQVNTLFPDVNWFARVVNMKAIEKPESAPVTKTFFQFPVSVVLVGNGLLVFFIVFSSMFSSSIQMFYVTEIITEYNSYAIIKLLFVALVSMITSDAVVNYLFNDLVNVPILYNLPNLFIGIFAYGWLVFKYWRLKWRGSPLMDVPH